MSTFRMMRIRVFFSKNEVMRYTGHLDLHKTWERIFRRSGLPLAYSQGFHPQPRLNLACALPLGFTSQAEILDAWLESPIQIEDIQTALIQSSPPGITIHKIEEVELRAPALQTQVIAAEYLITSQITDMDLNQKLNQVMNAQSIPRQWRGRAYDLRPLIEGLQRLSDTEQGSIQLLIRLAAREGATGRPEELLDVLGLPPCQTRVHRTKLFFHNQ